VGEAVEVGVMLGVAVITPGSMEGMFDENVQARIAMIHAMPSVMRAIRFIVILN